MAYEGPYLDINARIVKLARTKGVDAAKREWLRSDLFAPARRDNQLAQTLAKIVEGYSGEHWLRDGRYIHADSWDHLNEISAPSLVIVGELDLQDFRQAADGLAARIAGARKVVLTDCGHMSNMEQPGAFNRTLLDSLNALSPPT